MNRRIFLQRVSGGAPVRMSCERLYIRYMEAVRTGRVAAFLAALHGEIDAAGGIHLTDREWLSREDFRRTVAPLLARPAGSARDFSARR